MDVYSVHERAGYFGDIFFDLQGRAIAFALGIRPIAARTGLRCPFATSRLKPKILPQKSIAPMDLIL